MQKQISVVLSNGQIMQHALDFQNEEEYEKWVRHTGGLLMVRAIGTLNMDCPYAIYKFQEIIGIVFSEPPEPKPPLGFQAKEQSD